MAKAFSPIKQLQHLWLCHATAKTGCSEALEGFVGGNGAAELNAGGSVHASVVVEVLFGER